MAQKISLAGLVGASTVIGVVFRAAGLFALMYDLPAFTCGLSFIDSEQAASLILPSLPVGGKGLHGICSILCVSKQIQAYCQQCFLLFGVPNLGSSIGSGSRTRQGRDMMKFPPFSPLSVIVGLVLSDAGLFFPSSKHKNARLVFRTINGSF